MNVASIFSFVLIFCIVLLVVGKKDSQNRKTGVEEVFYAGSSQILLSRWLQHNWKNLTTSADLKMIFRKYILEQRDSLFGGTILNQIARSYDVFPIDLIVKILAYLEDEGYDIYVIWMDNDGDIPLHSAIKGMADPAYVSVFAKAVSKYTENTLRAKNYQEQVPLDLAFELGHFQAVEVLLELSIEHGVLAHLTGVHALAGTTLLHKAFQRGHVDYFRILLKVCEKLNVQILPVLLIPDSRGNTPWHYLMNRNKHHEIESVLSLCQKYDIDTNDLYLDLQRGTRMLHAAVRKNDVQCEKTLRKYGAKDMPDNRGILPSQRNHQLNSISSNQEVHKITSIKELDLMLQKISDWKGLCFNLGVISGVIDELQYSGMKMRDAKRKCLEEYINNGDATWEHVALAVRLYPIQRSDIADEIKKIYINIILR